MDKIKPCPTFIFLLKVSLRYMRHNMEEKTIATSVEQRLSYHYRKNASSNNLRSIFSKIMNIYNMYF